MKRDAIDLSTLNVFTLFRKYFVPTLLGMLSMSAVTAIDGIFVGHGVGSDGIAAVNICVPLLMLFTGIGLMVGAGCSVVASIQLSRGKSKSARLNVTQALLFVTIVALIPSALMMAFPAETARMLGSSEHLLPMVTDYLLWFVPSWVFQIWITVPLFVIRLDGAPKLAMLCSLITAVINVVLDWLFIFPFAIRTSPPLLSMVVPVSSSKVIFPVSPPSNPMLCGYRFIPFPCSDRKLFFSGLPVPSQVLPLVRIHPVAIPCASSPFPIYNDVFVPFCGIQYIRFPVAGANP